jgi:hypothetical protein
VISFAYNTTVPLEVDSPRAIENTNGLFIYFFIFGENNRPSIYEAIKKILLILYFRKRRIKKEKLPARALTVLHPLTVALMQVPSDGLHVAAVVANGEPFSLRLEHDDLYPMARALLAYQLSQPYPSITI